MNENKIQQRGLVCGDAGGGVVLRGGAYSLVTDEYLLSSLDLSYLVLFEPVERDTIFRRCGRNPAFRSLVPFWHTIRSVAERAALALPWSLSVVDGSAFPPVLIGVQFDWASVDRLVESAAGVVRCRCSLECRKLSDLPECHLRTLVTSQGVRDVHALVDSVLSPVVSFADEPIDDGHCYLTPVPERYRCTLSTAYGAWPALRDVFKCYTQLYLRGVEVHASFSVCRGSWHVETGTSLYFTCIGLNSGDFLRPTGGKPACRPSYLCRGGDCRWCANASTVFADPLLSTEQERSNLELALRTEEEHIGGRFRTNVLILSGSRQSTLPCDEPTAVMLPVVDGLFRVADYDGWTTVYVPPDIVLAVDGVCVFHDRLYSMVCVHGGKTFRLIGGELDRIWAVVRPPDDAVRWLHMIADFDASDTGARFWEKLEFPPGILSASGCDMRQMDVAGVAPYARYSRDFVSEQWQCSVNHDRDKRALERVDAVRPYHMRDVQMNGHVVVVDGVETGMCAVFHSGNLGNVVWLGGIGVAAGVLCAVMTKRRGFGKMVCNGDHFTSRLWIFDGCDEYDLDDGGLEGDLKYWPSVFD